jgi:hypothetical protein
MTSALPLLLAAFIGSLSSNAFADYRIRADQGGNIGQYLKKYGSIRDSGEQDIIDGRCVSACTLVVGVVPRARICVTSRAVLEFHAAWKPDANGHRKYHPEGLDYCGRSTRPRSETGF